MGPVMAGLGHEAPATSPAGVFKGIGQPTSRQQPSADADAPKAALYQIPPAGLKSTERQPAKDGRLATAFRCARVWAV